MIANEAVRPDGVLALPRVDPSVLFPSRNYDTLSLHGLTSLTSLTIKLKIV